MTPTLDAPPSTRYVEQVMGMPVTLVLRGRHHADDVARAGWWRVLRVLTDADAVFSTYREDSAISRLGRGELALGDCPPEVHEVLAIGEEARVESDGAFDVRRPDGRLDPSGVVKGWAVERAARALGVLTETDLCLSAGGDMTCRVVRPQADAWQIGIEDPHDPTRVLAVVPVHDGAVATSGLTHRGAHILDARTGRTPHEVASVTVVARDLVSADVDATSAFALGPDALAWLRTRPGRTGLVVWADGSTDTFAGHSVAG